MMGFLPPGLILVAGALLIPLTRGRVREGVVLGLPLLTLVAVWTMAEGHSVTFPFLEYTLEPVRWSATGRVFATVFSIMAFAGGLYALRTARTLELAAAFAYAGSAVGVTFAGDLVTLFVFWELMAVGSTLVLWASDQPGAYGASIRYLLIHLLGGVVLMVGVTWHIQATGSVTFGAMTPDTLATQLILAGFLINAGAPPLSAWIADAYPEASASGMVFLSAFTTKTAVYTLIVGFPGARILIFVGLYMAVYGIVYALLENDMRRILAYSIVNQVGFMVTGVGIGTEMALNGATAHAFTHIIYKALLLMSAGSVLYMTGKRKCTDLGGLFRTMPVTAIAGGIGALAISSFPYTSGFISKSMINQAAADEHIALAWFVLTAASAGVFLHAGIKFPWFVFFQKDSGLRPSDPPWFMRWPMWLFAFFCIALGVFPGPLYEIMPYPVEYVPYTASHLVSQFQLLLFAGLAFFVLLPLMKRTLTISLDFDWFYRVFGVGAARVATVVVGRTVEGTKGAMKSSVSAGRSWLETHHGPWGALARSWPSGSMVLWVAILLMAYLAFYLSP
ncbi:MAG: Na(+)/H(+) antiporter subunit D [Longimicrobiales bacterium]